ncbi:MAG: hypothetical protein JWM93_3930 [Frankiales bacterium]|nr:hypothetical protein [Frankiales bacterium]MCW3014670.1 hypothetical protein [Solirubrobacterales bacterium]
MKLRRLLLPILAAAATTGLTACGDDGPQKVAVSEGTYVTIGKVEYQVQISRQLNPTDIEDRDYLTGLSAADMQLKPDEVWFGIFIRAKNGTNGSLNTAQDFTLEDTVGTKFARIEAQNIVDYKPTTLGPGDVFPHSNEISSYGPTQGKLLLFKLTNSTLDNRPLDMKIVAPDGDTGSVEIDV